MPDFQIWLRVNPTKPLNPEVCYAVSDKELLQTDFQWTRYKNSGVVLLHAPEHHEWHWSDKGSQLGPHQFVGLKYNGEVQGLMMLSMRPIKSRRPESINEDVLYIEYLEAAPWNQSFYAGSVGTRFLGVGSCLISVAIEFSQRYGYNGRLGLHSLPLARSFYVHQGFESLGEDPDEGLEYFELPETPWEEEA